MKGPLTRAFSRESISIVKNAQSRKVILEISLFGILLSNAVNQSSAASASSGKSPVVAQCKDVFLRASYLAEETSGQGAGFLLTIQNNTSHSIEVADPIPLSVHWYALSNGHWLWRASSGSGGSLVNALHESGPLFAAQVPVNIHLSIPEHKAYTWTTFNAQTPALSYRPGCEHCTYKQEEQYRAVLAYASLPTATSSPASTFLQCGLRSQPVVMPPLSNSVTPRNSTSH